MLFPSRRFTAEEIYRNRYRIALTLTLAAVMELIDISIVNVAIPHMMGAVGATVDEITWVSTGYVVANIIVLPISSFLASYFGRRRYFSASIMLFIVASFFCGNAHSLFGLVFWRMMQGLGGGGLLSTSQSVIYEVFPGKEIGKGMSIFGMGIMLGPVIGPTIGGYITNSYSWEWIFFINIPIGVVALIFLNLYVPNSKFRVKVEKVDWVGLFFLALGIGTLQLFLERGERLNWFDSGEIKTYAICTLFSTVFFVWNELTVEHPVVDLRILKSMQFSVGLIFSFLLGMALFAVVFYLPLFIQTILHHNSWQAGLLLFPGALVNGFMMFFISKVLGRTNLDIRILVVVGVLIFGYSMVVSGEFTAQTTDAQILFPVILRGIGMGFMFIPLNNLALANIPINKIPDAAGIYTLVRQLGGSVGIALGATNYVHYLAEYKAILAEKLTRSNPAFNVQMNEMQQMLLKKGIAPSDLYNAALRLLDDRITAQAAVLTFEYIFACFAVPLVIALPLLFFIKNKQGYSANPSH